MACQPPADHQRHETARDQCGGNPCPRGKRARRLAAQVARRAQRATQQCGEVGARRWRLGQVAHGGGNRHAAGHPRGEPDGDQGEQQAQAKRDDDALRLDVDLQGKADARDGRAHQRDHERAQAQAAQHANGSGGKVVASALEEQHAHHVRTAQAQRAHNAQLCTALGHQQHENQENQQQTDEERKEGEER